MFNSLTKSMAANIRYYGKKPISTIIDRHTHLNPKDISLEGFFSKANNPHFQNAIEVLKKFEEYATDDLLKTKNNFNHVFKLGNDVYQETVGKSPDITLFQNLRPAKNAIEYNSFKAGISEQKLFAPVVKSIIEFPFVRTSEDMKKFYQSVDSHASSFKMFTIVAHDGHPEFYLSSSVIAKSETYEKLGYTVNFPKIFFDIGKETEKDTNDVFNLLKDFISKINSAIKLLEEIQHKEDNYTANLIHRQMYSILGLWQTAARCSWWDYYDHGASIAKKIATCYK